MLLKLRVRNFNGAGLKVEAPAVAALQERCHATWRAVAAYLMDSGAVLDAESVQQVVAPAFQPDVFLSHGRGDREQVLQLAEAFRGRLTALVARTGGGLVSIAHRPTVAAWHRSLWTLEPGAPGGARFELAAR